MVSREERILIEKGQQNPAWWIEEVVGRKLWTKQREIINALKEHERVAVPASFGVGKTYLAANAALQFLHNYYPSKIITTAPTGRQVKDLLWREIRTAHQISNVPLGGTLKTQELLHNDEWFATGFSTRDYDQDKFTGWHSPHLLLIFDQAAGISRDIWEAAEGLMVSSHVRWLVIGNTTDSTSEFANICMDDRKSDFGDWEVIKINAHQSPNVLAGQDIIPGIISHDWVEKKKKSWGPNSPLWRIFVEADFVSSDDMVLITPDMLNNLLVADVAPNYDNITVGLDVAWSGGDQTVWNAMAGGKLLTVRGVSGNDPMTVVGKTVRFIDFIQKKTQKEVKALKIDVIGVGAGICSRLEEVTLNGKLLPICRINSANSSSDEQAYMNLRAEMGWNLREKAEGGSLSLIPLWPTDGLHIDQMKKELNFIKYNIKSDGKVALQKKEDIKKKLKASPDYYDSLVMAVEENTGPSIELMSLEKEQEEFDFESLNPENTKFKPIPPEDFMNDEYWVDVE